MEASRARKSLAIDPSRRAGMKGPGSCRLAELSRGLDGIPRVVLAGLLLGLTLPLIVAGITLTALTSRGSALYAQLRVGRDGRLFRIYKIRTMVHDSEGPSGPRWAIPGDPRVTRFGRFLRRTHLDELPQLWNVMRGEMNLVGPRPERPEIMDEILRELPSYTLRTAINPGITGLAQLILGPDVDMEGVRRKLDCDRYYIMKRGFALDCKILLATPFEVIGLPRPVVAFIFGLPSPEDCHRSVGGRLECDSESDTILP